MMSVETNTGDSRVGAATRPSASRALTRYLPILEWARTYDRQTFGDDLGAALIVTIMLIPQSLAYAFLAGLPAEVGLYASILPLLAYAVFGTSRTLAVGPVAIVSLMTASALSNVADQGSPEYVAGAAALALLSGLMLVGMGLFRLGFLANLLSHPVVAGFIAGSAVVIAVSQLKHILGVPASGATLPELAASIGTHLAEVNLPTVGVGLFSLMFLWWVRKGLKPLLRRLGAPARLADFATRAGPVAAVVATTLAAYWLNLAEWGVAVVGEIPRGLPPLTVPSFDPELWMQLTGSAALISIIGFVESVAVAQTLAAKRRQRIRTDQELIGLGASNMAAAFTGGYPVTGGFARSVVNYDAGAKTPAAGAITALGIALATLFLTPLLYDLPQATLAATIIVAVLSLADFSVLNRTWTYSRSDFAAVAVTIAATLLVGVEAGVSLGVGISLLLYLYRSSRPHMAVIGLVPGTEHFRNVLRHEVLTSPAVLSVRVDESLYFANSRYLEDKLYELVTQRPDVKHVVLMCSAVNEIDASALESLEEINHRLGDAGVTFHLSEVKGPVMDRLKRSQFLGKLSGKVFLSHFRAIAELDPHTARHARDHRAAASASS
jgi:SulP family sulfate permease